MEENFKSKLGFILFFTIVIILLVGGYFYMNYSVNEKKNESNEKVIEAVDYKIDKDKDYIYYVNEETISEEAEIDYKDVVINLTTQKVLTEALEKENKMNRENIKYISDQEIKFDEIIEYNYDNIYSLTFRDYKDYNFGKYISLVINEYNYSCFANVTFNKSISYVFNTENGSKLTEDDLLNMYSINMNSIKEKIRDYLNSKQTRIDDVDVIKIDETVDNLEYSLYINDYGKLCVSLLVKTTQVDYNEIMEV